jgi:hypothetical protein
MGLRENWAELEGEILVPYPSASVCRPCNSGVRDIIPEQWRGGYQNMISVRILLPYWSEHKIRDTLPRGRQYQVRYSVARPTPI